MPEAREEFRGKDTGAEAVCQEEGNNLGEKIWDQKRSAKNKKEFRVKRREQKQSARSKEII